MEINSKTKSTTTWLALSALVGTGALLGLSTNLAKVASNQNLAPLPFLAWSLFGASIILISVSWMKTRPIPRTKKTIRYYFLAAFFSVAGSNLIFFSAIPHVGVSFVALAISLPPLLTYVIALIIGMEKFCRWRAAGVSLSLAGTAILVVAKWSAPQSNQFWIIVTLIGPILLAAGNIYRTTHWPVGERPESLAPGMLVAATIILLLASFVVPNWSIELDVNPKNIALIATQSIVFAGQFLLLFILQKVGGPVFLSLIGAVSAILGIPFAVALLNETVLPALLPSAFLIMLGIMFMIKPQLQKYQKIT